MKKNFIGTPKILVSFIFCFCLCITSINKSTITNSFSGEKNSLNSMLLLTPSNTRKKIIIPNSILQYLVLAMTIIFIENLFLIISFIIFS